MRTLEKNKQKMFYSLYKGIAPIYEYDSDGNKVVDFVDDDGTEYYREIGEKEVYDVPQIFKASIKSKLNEMRAKEYGVDQSSIYSEIYCEKGKLPFEFGTKIWKNSEIAWIDKENQIPDENSCDYTVKGILDEFLDYDFYLLERNIRES